MTYHIFLLFLQKQRTDNVDKNNTNVSSTVYTLLKQKALLETEYNEEKENFKRQMQAIGLERRIKRGDAWHPVRIGRSYYNSLNQLTIEVYRTSDEDIEHNFEFGKPVCFFKVEQDDRQDSATSKTDKHKGFDAITTGMVSYADADLSAPKVTLMFGKETKGLPEWLRERYADHCLRIPMRAEARSLNLSNSAAILCYEALRQQNLLGQINLDL